MANRTDLATLQSHTTHCFHVLSSQLNASPIPASSSNDSSPLFITWHSSAKGLRGCIGTFTKQPLATALTEYTLLAASDSRFAPITTTELPYLSCTVSLLHTFEHCTHLDWQLGVHGIQIKHKHYSATFLPSIATDQGPNFSHNLYKGWTCQETIDNAIRKAGYRGDIDEAFRQALQCKRYQTATHEMTYKQFILLTQQ